MASLSRLALIAAVAALPGATNAWAQATDGGAPVALKRYDGTAYIAWFGANRGGVGGDTSRDWLSTVLGGAAFGVYWTEHIKTEIELSTTGEDRLISNRYEALDGRTTRYTFRDHYYRWRTVTVLQSWQFLHNSWVHPFLGAGVDVSHERSHGSGRRQTTNSSISGPGSLVFEELPSIEDERVFARPIVAAGFKAYVTRHGFFRTDLRAGLDGGVRELTWRFGAGVDF